MEFFLRLVATLECMHSAESSAGLTNESIKCHPREIRTTDRIYNYVYEMTRLFHGVVLRARKEGREAHTACLSTLECEGMQEKYGNKRKYAVMSNASGVESYCRYIIRL